MNDNVILEKFDINKTYNGIKKFDCNHSVINKFVHKSMKKQIENDFSTAYVLLDLDDDEQFIGFYTITTFSIEKSSFEVPLKSSPKSVPVLRMIMLGVDKNYEKKGYGSKLLKHCLKLVVRVSDEIGIKGLYLDAEDKKHSWYEKFGFIGISQADSNTNILPMFIETQTIKDSIEK